MSFAQKDPITIFVSSTYQDLKDCRTEVEKQLVGLEQAVVGMEYFGATIDTPLETCKKKLEKSKLMVLLLGVSYGSIEPNSNKSYTENEYDYAVELGIPILVYEADLNSTSLGIAPSSFDTTNQERLNQFKKRVRSKHIIATFSSIDSLGKLVAHDIPAALEKLSAISSASSITDKAIHKEITEEDLKSGAAKYERFWLRPQSIAGQLIPVRLRLNKKFSGWKVKDELISALGLTVGDTISTEVSVQLGLGIIDDSGDMDLFADGEVADWLIDCVTTACGVEGCLIDCFVRLVYCKAPVGANSKIVNKASLVLERGIRFVGVDNNYRLSAHPNASPDSVLAQFLRNI